MTRLLVRWVARLLGVAIAAAAVAFVLPARGEAARHLRLERAEPAADTTVAAAPKELKLFFSEAVNPAVAGIRLLTSDSATVALGRLANGAKGGAAHPPVVAPITGPMKPGAYRVAWRVTGADGHTITGNFTFTLKSATADNSP
jgi:methionine-rich copper-binding protein CopC